MESTSEHGSEYDKRASEELFNGALAEVPNTNTIPDIVPEQTLPDSIVQEDLDYGDDDMDISHDQPDEAKNEKPTSLNEQFAHNEQIQEKEEQRLAEQEENFQSVEQQIPAAEDGANNNNEEGDAKGDKQSDKVDDDAVDDNNVSGRKGKKRSRDGTDNDCDEVEYIIEKIMSKQVGPNHTAKFLVKWENYPSSANTWEPLDNLVGCEEALKKFELERAKRLAKKSSEGQEKDSTVVGKGKLKTEVYHVQEVIGLTAVDNEKYFKISLDEPNVSPKFIRASLAKRMFPGKVIDFYTKHISWSHD